MFTLFIVWSIFEIPDVSDVAVPPSSGTRLLYWQTFITFILKLVETVGIEPRTFRIQYMIVVINLLIAVSSLILKRNYEGRLQSSWTQLITLGRNIHIYTYTHTHIHIYIHTYIIYTYTRIHTYVRTYIHTYIHTHTHTHTRGCIQKFPDWPPGARTAHGTALCH
jgi:hypothetical protein